MGCSISSLPLPEEQHVPHFESFGELSSHLARDGLESAQLVVGVDFSEAGLQQGEADHEACQQALCSIVSSLRAFAPSLYGGRIAAYGFGDVYAQNHSVFSFHSGNRPCSSEADCLQRYNELAEAAVPSGERPSFVPIVRMVLYGVAQHARFRVLVILTHSDLDDAGLSDFKHALDEAALHPLSVITVGVGDRKWHKIRSIRKHNHKFIQFKSAGEKDSQDLIGFAAKALAKLPRQCRSAKDRGLLSQPQPTESEKASLPKLVKPPDHVGKALSSSPEVSLSTSASTTSNSDSPPSSMPTSPEAKWAPDASLGKRSSTDNSRQWYLF